MLDLSINFYKEFVKIFDSNSDSRIIAIDKYSDNTAFTDFVINEINLIIEGMGLIPQNEYFRIDASGYELKHENIQSIKSFRLHCWNLKIAVEHENDPADWLDEIIKLSHISAPLRVVIGYVPMKFRDTLDSERLAFATQALSKLDCQNNIKEGEFLVILGNCNTNGNVDSYFNYKGYILNSDSLTFVPLENYI